MSDGTIRVLPERAQVVNEVFKPVSWLPKIDFIQRLILNNHVLISLLGESGSGKTTFVHLLHEELSSQIKPYIIDASPSFDRTEFLVQARDLLAFSGKPSLCSFLAQSKEQEFHVLLIIDDAHNLSPVFIEELLKELQQGSDNHFHVLLASDFSLVNILNALGQDTYQDMIHSIELGPLSETETKSYVVQNLLPSPVAEKILTDKRIKQFCQLTEGNFLEINLQMKGFFSDETTKLLRNESLSRYVNIAAGILLATTTVAYIGHSYFFSSVPTQVVSQPIKPPPNLVSIATAPFETAYSSDIPAYDVSAIRQALETTPLHQTELVAVNQEDRAIDESLVVMNKVIVVPKVIARPDVQPVLIDKKSKKAVVNTSSSVVKKLALMKSAKDVGHYTVQLIASHNKNELKRFVQVHHIKGKTQVRRFQNQGVVWYVLTLGEYAQRQYALQAVNNLPKEITQFKPWVRSISDLKVVDG